MSDNEEILEVENSVLDPVSRISEILFGLIMVLTFTGSLSAADIGREDVRETLIAAIGCNLAWGIIDAIMFLMSVLAAQSRNYFLFTRLKAAQTIEASRKVVASAMPSGITELLKPEHLDYLGAQVLERSKSKQIASGLVFADFVAAGKVFLLVFLSMAPVVLPFLIFTEPLTALRVSNLIAVIMLFGLGRELGKYSGASSPRLWGLVMALVGASLVSMTIALGG